MVLSTTFNRKVCGFTFCYAQICSDTTTYTFTYPRNVLGWEWSYDVNELAKALAKKNGVDLRLIQIPSVNEIKSSLVGFDLQLLKVPDNKDSRELIDYWAIDWDYKGDTFHNQWQSFRLKKNPKVDYEASHNYEDQGEYQIMVKVVDVFGNDTNKLFKVRIG